MACLGDSPGQWLPRVAQNANYLDLRYLCFINPQLMRQGRKLRRSRHGKQVFGPGGAQSLSVPRLLARTSLSTICTGGGVCAERGEGADVDKC